MSVLTMPTQDSLLDDDQFVPLQFLDRNEIWETIKPYSFHYTPKADFPLHNLKRSAQITRIKNLRPYVSTLSLDVQGFEVHHVETQMKYSDFDDEAIIENVYMRELEKYVKGALGAKEVRGLDFQLRKKNPAFPKNGGRTTQDPQPALMAHVDVTLAGARSIVHELFEDTSTQILESRFQIITVWRPLHVPVRDWPLALCDASSVDPTDLMASDVIYPNYLAENRLVHFNDKQNWYWLPDQTTDEVLLFKAMDSDESTSRPCPHGAFPLPSQDKASPPRKSIDARLLVMYADIVYPESKPWSS